MRRGTLHIVLMAAQRVSTGDQATTLERGPQGWKGTPMTATRSPFSISSDVLSNSMRSWYPCVSFSMLSARCLSGHGGDAKLAKGHRHGAAAAGISELSLPGCLNATPSLLSMYGMP